MEIEVPPKPEPEPEPAPEPEPDDVDAGVSGIPRLPFFFFLFIKKNTNPPIARIPIPMPIYNFVLFFFAIIYFFSLDN